MADGDLSVATTTDLAGKTGEFSVNLINLDEPNTGKGETYWYNSDFAKYMGYYKTIPELKSAIDSMVMWTVGRGWVAGDKLTQLRLESIRGWGEDSFQAIMQNHETITMINGDAYTEIIRNEQGTLINLKPLNPANIRHVVDEKGLIKGYDIISGKVRLKRLKPQQVLHSTENRVGNEIHGVSKVESVRWIIDARNEAMHDLRRIMHRSTIRVLYVDEEDTSRLSNLRTQYREGIKNGDVLILPVKKGEAEFEDLTIPPTEAFLNWIRYLENLFYKEVGVPEVILGGSQQYTEASSKVGYLTFEQPYMTRQRLLEADLWHQVGIKVKFLRPQSLKDDLQKDEEKNTGQTGVQANEVNVGVTRNE